jgi:hypothetical protein
MHGAASNEYTLQSAKEVMVQHQMNSYNNHKATTSNE